MGSTIAGNGRGFSTDLWYGFDVDSIFIDRDENVGFGIHPNFACFDRAVDAAAPTVFYGPDGARGYADSTSASIAQIAALMGGAVRLATGATQYQEAWLQWGGATGSPFVISDTDAVNLDLRLEMAVRVSNSAFANQALFVGLAEEGSAAADFITDLGAMADKDFIGWFLSGDNGLDFVYRKAGQAMQTHAASWKTLAIDTWYHFGLEWDTDTDTVTPWYGTGDRSTTPMAQDKTSIITSTTVATATFPDGSYMSPIIGTKGLGTANVQIDCRLLGVAQLAPAAD